MAAPNYLGCGQPSAGSGLLGGLGGIASWFGVQTPSYAGENQPIPGGSGYFGSSTPAYRSASAVPTAVSDRPAITVVIPSGLLPQQ